MGKKSKLLLYALCALAFFLLAINLVEGPAEEPSLAYFRAAAPLFLIPDPLEHSAGDQRLPNPAPPVGEPSPADVQAASPPGPRADANGHPLGGRSYIRAVYQSFRLEATSG